MPRRRTDRRRVLILSGSFGGVHAASAEAIARYLRGRHSQTVEVESVDLFEECAPNLNVLARFAYQQTPDFFPSFSGTFAEMSEALAHNPVVHELAKGGLRRVEEALASRHPDAVVSTFPFAAGAAAESKAVAPFVSAAVLTDYDLSHAWLHPRTDLYFVPVREVREELVVKGVPWDRVVVSGIPLRGDIAGGANGTETGLADRFTATLAGPWASESQPRELAAELSASAVQVAVLTAGSDKLRRRIDSLSGAKGLVKTFDQPAEGLESIRRSDVLVTRAGSEAMAEGLSAGAAVIVYNPIPGQELRNVDFLVNYGAVLAARDDADVVEKVRFLSAHPERVRQLAENGSVLGRKAAVQAVCERVLAALR